jgi:carbamate kinase
MSDAVVILVNGELLAGEQNSTIPNQRQNARKLAEGLLPVLCSKLRIALLYGLKPQVGFVLFRAELASHLLHRWLSPPFVDCRQRWPERAASGLAWPTLI